MECRINVPEWARFFLSDLSDWDRSPRAVKPGETLTLELPDDVYFEYAFIDSEGTQQPDPDNAQVAMNPWYPAARAICGPAYRPDPYASPEADLPEGETLRERLDSNLLHQRRRLILYTPHGHRWQRLPIVYVQDGVAYYRVAKLTQVFEALLRDGLVRPAHLVFIEPHDRSREYSYDSSYRRFVLEEVIPFCAKQLTCSDERLLMGASLGGLVSATLAWLNPGMFRSVLTQSGAFLGTPDDPDFYTSQQSWWLEQIQQQPMRELRVYLESGTLEWLHNVNRDIAAALEAKNYPVCYQERSAGHNWVNWRNGIQAALRFGLETSEH